MSDQKTEQPTQKRLEKARKEGRFATSREFISAVQFLAFTALLIAYGSSWWGAGRELMRALLTAAFHTELTRQSLMALLANIVAPQVRPVLTAGCALALLSCAGHLLITKFGFAPEKLTPDFGRLNPMQRLRGMPQQNLHSAMEALLMLPVFLAALWWIVRDNLDAYLRLPLSSLEAGVGRVAGSFESLLWKAAGLFFVFGCLDLLRQTRRHANELRMTKQEIRDEHKESEGNPQIKMQIRRIRRDLLRRQMIRKVPTATAVIVNPTHFAVAIRYEIGAMTAPVCIAKGKNYLALRIKQIAIDHDVPIVENPPLAQALYKSVEVDQEIPSHLYRAVAEILAYIYRLTHR